MSNEILTTVSTEKQIEKKKKKKAVFRSDISWNQSFVTRTPKFTDHTNHTRTWFHSSQTSRCIVTLCDPSHSPENPSLPLRLFSDSALEDWALRICITNKVQVRLVFGPSTVYLVLGFSWPPSFSIPLCYPSLLHMLGNKSVRHLLPHFLVLNSILLEKDLIWGWLERKLPNCRYKIIQ